MNRIKSCPGQPEAVSAFDAWPTSTQVVSRQLFVNSVQDLFALIFGKISNATWQNSLWLKPYVY